MLLDRDTKSSVQKWAMEGFSAERIEEKLRLRGVEILIERAEIERLVLEARAAGSLMRSRSYSKWPIRLIGGIALAGGIGATILGTAGGVTVGRYSPAGYGLWAIGLGAILLIRPDLAREKW